MLICIYCVIFITGVKISFCIQFLKRIKKIEKRKQTNKQKKQSEANQEKIAIV